MLQKEKSNFKKILNYIAGKIAVGKNSSHIT